MVLHIIGPYYLPLYVISYSRGHYRMFYMVGEYYRKGIKLTINVYYSDILLNGNKVIAMGITVMWVAIYAMIRKYTIVIRLVYSC